MNDDFLNKFRKEPRPEFASALYQRINKPMQTQSKQRALRLAALTLSILAVLTVTILISPSARAFAQGLLERVGGYAFTLGVPQRDASRVPDPISIVRTSDSVAIHITGNVLSANDPTEAGKLAGFAVLAPSYLPSAYTAMSDWFVTTEGNGTVVTNGYRDTTNNFLIVNQWKVGDGDLKTYAREQIVDVAVRGRSGVWFPDPSAPNGKEALVWEENGITYSLLSNSLSLDEMLKVAESLSQ